LNGWWRKAVWAGNPERGFTDTPPKENASPWKKRRTRRAKGSFSMLSNFSLDMFEIDGVD
jgi:hypothetical protein